MVPELKSTSAPKLRKNSKHTRSVFEGETSEEETSEEETSEDAPAPPSGAGPAVVPETGSDFGLPREQGTVSRGGWRRGALAKNLLSTKIQFM